MTPAIAPFVSAISVMLAAYGFFYNVYKDGIAAGEAVGSPSPDEGTREGQRALVRHARAVTSILAVIALLVWLVFLPEVIDQIGAAIDVRFALARYSALDVAFVILANSWLVIAGALGLRAATLRSKLSEFPQ